jgi:hypothetical protein
MDQTLMLTVLIGTVIPILNGLLTKWESQNARVFLQIVLNAANGFLVEWATQGAGYDWGNGLRLTVISLVTAIATQAGVWRPLGVSAWAKTKLVKSDMGLAG